MSFPKNCPQLQDLPDLPPTEIAALPADMLAVLQHESETALKQAKIAKSRLDGALVLKYGTEAAEARREPAASSSRCHVFNCPDVIPSSAERLA